ncbi:uncharacterized protein LOC106457978 isoform X2 [Limulus polyphemus]|uniref:Uncharacterized protein LOC106457978 isoform X2 n=1 Tax=Limulus polyphemus TaxID=6850 RepID=A0ABM1S844_LIMPO|nr:uncharacterized protein LOC106457978 isoform X2 [Limulus polyphemus]
MMNMGHSRSGISILTFTLFIMLLTTDGATSTSSFSGDVKVESLEDQEDHFLNQKEVTEVNKRAIPFLPMRGRREYKEKQISLEGNKRASGFFGMRGKKEETSEGNRAITSFGFQGKRDYVDDKRGSSFFGMRGKKTNMEDEGGISFTGNKNGEINQTPNFRKFPTNNDFHYTIGQGKQDDIESYISKLKEDYLRNGAASSDSYLPETLEIENKRSGTFFGMRGKRNAKIVQKTTKEG